MSTFLRPINEYKREINVIDGYMEQTAIYLHKSTGKPMEVVREWLKKEFKKGGRFEFKAPIANVNVRDPETGDRRATRVDMATLLRTVHDKNIINSPSLTFYLPPSVKRSVLSIFIDENIAKRAAVKQEMFTAIANNDEVLAANKKNEQNSVKTLNNAASGAHSSPYTILYNKSTHSSLTSTCRSATSYGNANNEKVLAGSRHYWLPGIVVNNILSTLHLTNFAAFKQCMDLYDLHYPSVEETMEVIRYSTKLFWRNGKAMATIRDLVEKIEPLERAAFVYIGDLYHLRKFNDRVMRNFIAKMVTPQDTLTVPPEEVEKLLDGDLVALCSLLRADVVGPYGNSKELKKKDVAGYHKFLATAYQVVSATREYDVLIREILTTRNVPASIARLPDTIRRVSLVSDTDSTMATVQEWAEWHTGEMTGKAADDVSDVMIYIATQNIAHMMGRMSANMGVEESNIHRYSMKNEFKFSAFALTNKAKHYFSLITSQEGVLREDPELEVKGVALRTSNIPDIIMKEFRTTIQDMCAKVMAGDKIRIIPHLERIAQIELDIVQNVVDGGFQYLKTGQVKNKEAYSIPESSNYFYHEMWAETFGPKYGASGDPTYNVVKIAVNLENKTAINKWIAEMKDRELASRIKAWSAKYPKRTFVNLLLPEAVVSATGIPKEILDVADFRRIIFASVEPYYHVLECFNICMIDKNRTLLVSDYFGGLNAKTTSEVAQSIPELVQ
jgi:hypothetical protein